MSERGACVVASNQTQNTDENDNFFDDLYSSLSIERISASRAINSVATGRGSVSELLISNCGGLGA